MNDKPDISTLLPDNDAIDARSRVLEAELRPRSRAPRGASRHVAIAACALVALGSGAAWATGAFSAKEIAINEGVGCFDRPSFRGTAAFFQSASDPVAKCGRLWREGLLEPQGEPRSQTDGNEPHLVACTAPDEPVLVFPGPDDLCGRLGLKPLPEDYAAVGRAHAHAFAALDHVGELVPATSECPSPKEAAARARARLPERYSNVAVAIDGQEPCAREYRAIGGKIIVRTMSRAVARQERDGERVSAALLELTERLSRACLPSDSVRRAAFRHLSLAGIDGVTVQVNGSGPCVLPSWRYDMGRAEVELHAGSGKRWMADPWTAAAGLKADVGQ